MIMRGGVGKVIMSGKKTALLGVVCPASLCIALAGAAGAQKQGAARPVAAGKHRIVVNNGHDTPLAILSVTPPGAGEADTVILLRDLPAKIKKTVALPGTACVFDVYGRFEDDSTIGYSKLNLCKDPRINIVD
jgi:hypothetical protein